MTKLFDVATELHKMEYATEPPEHVISLCKKEGITIVYGYSDDCAEFRGSTIEELNAWDGNTYISNYGRIILSVWNDFEIEGDEKSKYSFYYLTDIPHENFEVHEDGKPYCLGIVFEALPDEKWDIFDEDEYEHFLQLKDKYGESK